MNAIGEFDFSIPCIYKQGMGLFDIFRMHHQINIRKISNSDMFVFLLNERGYSFKQQQFYTSRMKNRNDLFELVQDLLVSTGVKYEQFMQKCIQLLIFYDVEKLLLFHFVIKCRG